MKLLRKLRSSMSLNVLGGLVFLMLLFGLIVSIIGNSCFVNAFKDEYATVTYHMADSAASFINGNHINDYLAGREEEEYTQTKRRLDISTQKMNVSLLYVIAVDTSDYGSFVSVFNSVNNSVDDSEYTEWEIGYERKATNEEYSQKYRALYEHKSKYETVFRMQTNDGAHPHITTLVPIQNRDGDVTALMCVQRPMREMENAFRPYVLLILSVVLFMVILISALATLFLKNSIIHPVEKVSKEATRFAKESAKGEPLGKISRYEDIQNLAGSIDRMETDMVSYIDNLTAVTAEKERMGVELSIAAQIQANSLPDVFPAFPNRNEFDIYALMDPAKEVGGDFYNFFLIDDDHLALVIADVSGKGIPAALFMMVTNILISDRTMMGGTPGEILSFVNENICARNRADMFVTVWLGILEISTGKLTASNAGHENPVIYRKGKHFEVFKDPHGFVIGGLEGMRYKDYEIRLNKGDKLFLYTDGLPEATDSDQKLYTVERMAKELNLYQDGSPQEIIEGMQISVNDFVGDAPQFDDLTMLCIEIKDEDIKNNAQTRSDDLQ